MTLRPLNVPPARPLARRSRRALASGCLFGVLLLVLAGATGCGPDAGGADNAGGPETTETTGSAMAGPVVDVQVTQEALDSRPKPWVLATPESAVRSFLDWTSYAYRIGQSSVAVPTMSANWEVHVDSYIQYNIQKYRLLDQSLTSITFGTPVAKDASTTVLPAKETWTYRYVSAETAGKTLGGPYTADYETTYTLVKSDEGAWVVDVVDAKALGPVK